jgi:uncharacterized protein YlxP (DUF503 family)
MIDAPAHSHNVTQLPVRHRQSSVMNGRGFAGLMVLDVHIPGAQSLKDKRHALRGTIQRIRNAGYSASEVDHQDSWQRAQIAVSIVSGGSNEVEQLLDAALRRFEAQPQLVVHVRQRTVLAIDEYE